MTNNTPEILSAAVSRYGYVVVEVAPFRVTIADRTVEIFEYLGDEGDRGGYLVGRGYLVRKDGSTGVRRIDVDSRRTPENVREAARELFEPSAA